MGITLKDIATACNVDISTVSRAMRDDERVKPKTRALIQQTAKDLGYRVNLTARNLAAGKTRTAWFILPSLPTTIERELALYAGPFMREAGYDLLIALYHNDLTTYKHLIERLTQGVCDGALIMPGFDDEKHDALAQLETDGFPLVFIDRHLETLPTPVVTNDNLGSSRHLVRECIENGAKGFVVQFSDRNAVERNRAKGAIQEIKKAGLPYCHVPRPVDGEADLRMLKKSRVKSLGIISNGQWDIVKTVQDHMDYFRNKRMIFGCYDRWSGDTHPGIRAVVCHQNFEQMARTAVELLLKRIESPGYTPGKKITRVTPLQFETVIRQFD